MRNVVRGISRTNNVGWRGLVALPLCVFAMMVWVGCAGKLTADNFAKIESGMTEEQVKGVLGQPSKVETASFLGTSGSAWIYQQGASEAQVIFLNGVVFQKTGSLKN
jgi:outer membrane protein assembly factor BamE (lipoprotein component of BamABCDE complex)